MNQIVILSILVAILIVAVALVSTQIEKVGAVHTTIIAQIKADINAQDRFMTINVPDGASSIPSTAVTLEKTDGYVGFATIVLVITTNDAGKAFKLQADTNSDGVADTDVASVTLSPPSGTKIATGNIPNGTDRLFISSAGASAASFSASVMIQFDSITP